MTNSSSENRAGEFELIAKLFAPLSCHAPGAYGLTDDAATIAPPAGEELVVTADLLTEGVHFRTADPPDRIAKKAVRVNLSDLAAKGAKPLGYLLSLALPRRLDMTWLEVFAHGLAEDQNEFAVVLVGGDTTATDGPFTVAVTAFGTLPVGSMIRRNGAKAGDLIFVSGSIGDAGAGLELLNDTASPGAVAQSQTLVDRYQLPTPRTILGQALRGAAHASLDVSDGLLADLGHVARTSGVRTLVNAEAIPISAARMAVKGQSLEAVIAAATAGDDYEIAFTAPATARDEILRIARNANTPVTQIGQVVEGAGVALLDSFGAEIPVSRKGYEHF
ncbi:MAG TPA: thiamine-phosphate kinase [Rhizomicrobium sp.]|nr:thiamine-phosphate kinase [Rhizomicrobium sp.]